MKKAAIVILNYNGKEMLEKFLPVIIQNSSFEIIIADNASTDESVNFLESQFSQLRTIILSSNSGFSGGYNEALKQIQGEFAYYILLNSDVEVSPNWDIELVDWLEVHAGYVAVQPKILSQQAQECFDYAGAGGGYIDRLGFPFCRGRILNTIEKDQGQYDDTVQVDWVSGACFAIRAEIFHEMGGFEDIFFAHMEEIDLCWRMNLNGYKLGYLGAVGVYHVGGGTLSRNSPYKTYLNFRNNLLMLYKNLSTWGFIKVMLVRGMFDIVAALYLFLGGKTNHAKKVVSAYIDFYKMRNQIQKTLPLASKLPFQNAGKKVYSIIMTYYLKRKKIYSRI
ncbi:glycosyltransferase family 2 protein [Echinicola marina]|uniref:glycosyltransferase family 2 protein n=1 Tax=Echinicola marina TaxID=2859768 RepID=UPI001CF61523|nr:glycosyltransferase family 2 protein [Echinicola marina]UCS93184.1 glycosyltransferase family 2 protein [Echinicola marina]